jgi:hypothetical protein
MDEFAVFFHTGNQEPVRAVVENCQPDTINAIFLCTRTKQMVLVFLVSEGVLYVNQIRRGTTINAVYIKKALERFLVFFKKRPTMSSLH